MKYVKTWIRWITIVSIVALSAGCAGVSGSFCSVAEPIWWESQEELQATPQGIKRQIVSHNEVWERLCK